MLTLCSNLNFTIDKCLLELISIWPFISEISSHIAVEFFMSTRLLNSSFYQSALFRVSSLHMCMMISHGTDTNYKGPTAYSFSCGRHRQNWRNFEIAEAAKQTWAQLVTLPMCHTQIKQRVQYLCRFHFAPGSSGQWLTGDKSDREAHHRSETSLELQTDRHQKSKMRRYT